MKGFGPPQGAYCLEDELGFNQIILQIVMIVSGSRRSLEKEMATHSSILAWNIPWAEECVRLHSPWGHRESDTTEPLHFLF